MMRTGYDALMHEACVVWGFCGCIKREQPLHVDLLIPPDGPVTAGQFVDWLFLADNLNPYQAPERWQRQKEALRAAFVRHMGAETVDARLLRWSDVPPDDDEPDRKFRGKLPD
jgi:hypothetical protein